jgi:hypothetical protein
MLNSKIRLSYKIKKNQITHHYRPGVNLSELEFKKLTNELLLINSESKVPINNKMLNKDLSIEQFREIHKNSIICMIHEGSKAVGFLISPIISDGKTKAMHIGLMIVTKNCGNNLIALAGVGNTNMAFKNFGNVYVTNVASTPSVVEAYTMACADTWPSPNVNLRSTPKDRVAIVELLEKNYLSKYFPDDCEIFIDKKRFIMRSSSQEMGFNTNLRELSRSSSFKFQSFCHTWIDYSQEEDIIQVSHYKMKNFLVNTAYINYLILKSKLPQNNKANNSQKKFVKPNSKNKNFKQAG